MVYQIRFFQPEGLVFGSTHLILVEVRDSSGSLIRLDDFPYFEVSAVDPKDDALSSLLTAYADKFPEAGNYGLLFDTSPFPVPAKYPAKYLLKATFPFVTDTVRDGKQVETLTFLLHDSSDPSTRR